MKASTVPAIEKKVIRKTEQNERLKDDSSLNS